MINNSPHPLIICLQEVHPLLLDNLKNIIQPNQIAIGQETPTNYLVTLISHGHINEYKQINLVEIIHWHTFLLKDFHE